MKSKYFSTYSKILYIRFIRVVRFIRGFRYIILMRYFRYFIGLILRKILNIFYILKNIDKANLINFRELPSNFKSFLKRNYLLVVLSLSLLGGLVSFKLITDEDRYQKISIIHTDSLYGNIHPHYIVRGDNRGKHIGGLSKISKTISNLINEVIHSGGDYLLLDAGNTTFTGNNIFDYEIGETVIKSMNHIGYNAMVIGDLEVGNSAEKFWRLANDAKFPILCANVQINEELQKIYKVKPYIIIERGNLKIAVLGLSNPDMHLVVDTKHLRGLTFKDYSSYLQKYLEEIKSKQVDVVIVLSNLSSNNEELNILRKYSDKIDLLVANTMRGLDDQHFFEINGKHLVKTPRRIKSVGKYDILYDRKDKKVVKRKWSLVPAMVAGEDSAILSLLTQYKDMVNDSSFDPEIGISMVNMRYETINESLFADYVTDAMLARGHAEMAFINSPNIRNLPEGVITYGSIIKAIPYDQGLVLMDLTGKQVKEILETSYHQIFKIGIIQFAGLKVKYDLGMSFGQKVIEVLVNDRPLDLSKVYRVITTEFLFKGGDNFTTFSEGKNIEFFGTNLRNLIVNKIKTEKTVYATVERRMISVGNYNIRSIACSNCETEESAYE